MDLVLSWLQSGMNLILPFVVLISLTVFVHELGHFMVAKYFGVRVEVFSIGIGKKIWKRRRGDTEYAISLLPIGGYVKMFGDEMGAEVESTQKQYSFVHKPVLQRIGVVLAGPFMNLFFSIFLFIAIAMVGEDQKAPVVGDISEASVAYQVGFRSGDKVVEVGEKAIRTWAEFQAKMSQSIGQELVVKVSHRSGAEETLKLTPQSMPDMGLLSLNKTMGSVPGLTNLASEPGVGVAKVDSWAYRAGFRTGDFISKVNGQDVKYWREAEDKLLKATAPFKVTVIREQSKDKFEPTELEINEAPTGATFADVGLERGELFLAKVMPGTPAEVAGLKVGDKLLEIQGTPVNQWDVVQNTVKSFKQEDGSLKLKVERSGELKTFEIIPVMTSTTSPQGLREDRFTIGIVPWLFPSIPEITSVKYGLSLDAFARGLERTWEVTAMTLLSFVKLFKAEISPKNISGIISIGQAASETFKMGLSQFFSMMGVISINLFILNLLPIPVLDGGHMVFYTIEFLKGSPLSLRKIEMAQRFGIVVLMSLMVFALFNDFSRFFGK
jgi:regulator of sigma E protease